MTDQPLYVVVAMSLLCREIITVFPKPILEDHDELFSH